MSYKSQFFAATDVPAYTAIRHKVDGGIEPISGMRAGGPDNTLQVTAAVPSVDNSFTPT